MGVGAGKIRPRQKMLCRPLFHLHYWFFYQESEECGFYNCGGMEKLCSEIYVATEVICENDDKDAGIVFSALIEDAMHNGFNVTVLACGFRNDDDNNFIA